MKQEPNWYSLDMLPTYLMLSKEELRESERQLKNLEACKDRPYILDDNTVNRIIKVHTEQNELMCVPIEQCLKWREQFPSKEQLSDITKTEDNLKKLNEINKQILALAESLKKGTIDSILKKSDLEIALDFLCGQRRF